MAKRNAQGAGTIRHRKDGRWEARYTIGINPGSGKQIQRSIYGKTQKDVLSKLKKIHADIDSGQYVEPAKMNISEWFDIWVSEYLGNVKLSTVSNYKTYIRNHIKPDLGAVALQKLTPHMIQKFYNSKIKDGKSPKTVKNLHGILHKGLAQAVKLGYMKTNPCDACTLPRSEKKEVKMMDDTVILKFLNRIEGHQYETLYFVDLFTGMRQGEILGMTWDCVDFKKGILIINKQLIRARGEYSYHLSTTKHDKRRTVKPAPIVMDKLKSLRNEQFKLQQLLKEDWSNDWNLVFTNSFGGHLCHQTVYKHFKRIADEIGHPELTFHAMRHSYAVINLMEGVDVKTIQENLGHHTAAFTLDVYGHVTERMQDEAAAKMEKYIKTVKEV